MEAVWRYAPSRARSAEPYWSAFCRSTGLSQSMSISSIIQDPDVLLGMAPEELAGPLLICLIDLERSGTKLNRYNYSLGAADGYPERRRPEIGYALMEAWAVLENEALIAPWPGNQGEWVFVTRRGQQLRTPEAFRAYRATASLPREALHPALVARVRAAYARGDYDTAVFEAFKEVEVHVRVAARMTRGLWHRLDATGLPCREGAAGGPNCITRGASGAVRPVLGRDWVLQESSQPSPNQDRGKGSGGDDHAGQPSSKHRRIPSASSPGNSADEQTRP